eukprot:Transcript_26531.p3 GENE.Transcript_26531~~Transcript_26531.p3  ORF type:complete len:408 (+),score=198.94 Transcript_26531:70-1293(+)
MLLPTAISSRPLLAARAAAPAMLLDATALDAAASVHTSIGDVTTSLAFADQAGNLAGALFPLSLPSYLLFLYFLGYEGNRCPKTAQFGSQFLLLFVVSTVVTGIVTKGQYQSSLADVDWLHGGAEALLTTSNLFLGFGLASTLNTGKMEPADASMDGTRIQRYAAGALALAVFGSAFAGPQLGLEQHSAFLFGAGALPADLLASSPLPLHAEPANALSIPTWAIHFSSVFEYLFAMGMVWQMAALSGNEKWKGLTWGMLPLHASGVAACTYHFFYNNPELSFLVLLQAALTLVGNTTCAIAAGRLALSNGWTLKELNPFDQSEDAAPAAAEEPPAAPVAIEGAAIAPNAAKLVVLTLLASFGIKYGEMLLGPIPYLGGVEGTVAGALLCFGFPALTAARFNKLSSQQ